MTSNTSVSAHVGLAGRVLDLNSLRDRPAAFATLFARARAETGYGQCLCRTPPLRLVIRCTRAGRWHLAGWPGDGHRHAPGCMFHKTSSDLTGRGACPAGAITATEEGIELRVNQPLLLRDARVPGDARPGARDTRDRSSGAMSLLGLLHWLWEEAHLNRWSPGWHRSWATCRHRLLQLAATCQLNSQPLLDVLHIAPPRAPRPLPREQAAFANFTDRLSSHPGAARRGLVLGELSALSATPYGQRVHLAGLSRPIFASDLLMARLHRSYRTALSESALRRGRRVVLALVERSPTGYLKMADAGMMLTDIRFIPADSSFEVTMADHLVAGARQFIKPLRYDATDTVFPDFVLMDDEPFTVVEVYGIRGREAYERRKRIKQQHYAEQEIPLVEWDVHQPLPQLPARAPRRF